MSVDDTEENRDAFSLFDKQGDGKVECSEIGDILRALGLNPTESEVNKIVGDLDPNPEHPKRISYEEFIPLLRVQKGKKTPANSNFESFSEGFRIFDRDNNGMVSVAEIRHILTSLGDRLTGKDVDVLVSGMEDSQGMINYEEFVRGVLNG